MTKFDAAQLFSLCSIYRNRHASVTDERARSQESRSKGEEGIFAAFGPVSVQASVRCAESQSSVLLATLSFWGVWVRPPSFSPSLPPQAKIDEQKIKHSLNRFSDVNFTTTISVE